MLCTNGHNNPGDATFCTSCGVNTFQPVASALSHGVLAQPAPYNGLAIASMVLGICWVLWIGSVLAIVFGYVARRQIRQRGGQGSGMAVAGIVLGWVGVAFFALFVALAATNQNLTFNIGPTASDINSCTVDGADITNAMNNFASANPSTVVTEAGLLSNAHGGPFLDGWPGSASYNFYLHDGTLFVQSTSSGLTPVTYDGTSSCVAAGVA